MAEPDTSTVCPRCQQPVPLALAFGFPGERWIKCGDCHLLFGIDSRNQSDDRVVET